MGVHVEQSRGLQAPDGGWGWAVLMSCFVVTGFSYAFPKAVSVYFKELMRDFGVGYSDTAWISSIMLAMLYGSGPLSSIMVNKFGCRPVMLFGGLLASAGMVVASFTTNIVQLYLTAGVVTGMGLALNFQPSLIMLGCYFDRRRPLANGLAAAGSPVFLSALSPLGQVLVDCYGWRGGFLIMGGVLLNCCTCGAIMRPLQQKDRKEMEGQASAQELKEMIPSKTGLDNSCKIEPSEKNKENKNKRKLLDFSVLRNKSLAIYIIAKFIVVLGLFIPTILLVNYAKDQGIPDHEAAFLLSIIGFIDIFARPTCGLVAGLKSVRPRMAYFFSLALLFNGLTDVCSARSTSYTGLVVFCIFFGLSYGMVGALQFEVLMGLVGTSGFSSALGLVLLIEAMAVLIGPPSAGRLVDTYKNYELIFYMAGGELIAAGVFLCVASYCCVGRAKKPNTATEGNQDVEKNLLATDGSDADRGSKQACEVAWKENRSKEGTVDKDCF